MGSITEGLRARAHGSFSLAGSLPAKQGKFFSFERDRLQKELLDLRTDTLREIKD